MTQAIYADHAATSYPRLPEVIDAMVEYMRDIGCNPGRGGYRKAMDAARMVYETRSNLAHFFHVPQPEQVIFTPNVTYALNLVLKRLLAEGDHVLISSMEHNAVVRPLARLAQERFISVRQLPCNPDGTLDAGLVKRALRPDTRLVILTHASNVTGTLLPVYEVGELLRGTDTLYCVDAAQSAGSEEVDFAALHCDYLAFTGHKGLLGPPGIGGLCLSERAVSLTEPLIEGGTGSRSEDERQPDFLPDKFESGTQNVPGIAGLGAGVKQVMAFGLPSIRRHKAELTAAFLEGLLTMPQVTVYGTRNPQTTTATVSLTVKGIDSGDLSFMLEQAYGIMTRSGLHCAPLAHKTIGTFPEGTVRFSFGLHNTLTEVRQTLEALQEIISHV